MTKKQKSDLQFLVKCFIDAIPPCRENSPEFLTPDERLVLMAYRQGACEYVDLFERKHGLRLQISTITEKSNTKPKRKNERTHI